MKWSESHSVVPDSLRPCGLYSPWNSPGQSTGVGGLSLLQGIFATQGWKPGLLHCRQILYCLSHKGSPRILGWVAYPFSSGYSWPRNWTQVSCIAGRFFTSWAIAKSWTWLKNFHFHFERKSTKIIWITNIHECSVSSKHYSMYCFCCISIHELKQNLKILQNHALNISWRLENSNHTQFCNHRTNKNCNEGF